MVNLSKHSLSFHVYKLVNKNLNFISTLKRYNKNQLPSDTQNFFCPIKLQAHFKDETCIATVNRPNEQAPFKIKRKEQMDPRETHQTVRTYFLVENDIKALMKQPTKKLKSNLTYKEHTAMEELAKRKDLIITNVDKGRAVVIMDTVSYIKEPNQQLSDKSTYKQLTTT